MRPPWIEAPALLGAAGFSTAPVILDRDMESDMRNPRYALLPRLNANDPLTPFDDLAGLAAHIEKQRYGQGLQLQEIDGFRQKAFRDAGRTLHLSKGRDVAVQVWTTMLDGTPDRSLGFAWLAGEGRETLQRALAKADTGRRAAA